MDFDAAWDAWMAAGHGDCGGWKYDPGPAVVGCACGAVIPFPAQTARHQTAAAGDDTRDQRHTPRPRGGADEHGTDPAPAAAGAAPSPGTQPLPPLPGIAGAP